MPTEVASNHPQFSLTEKLLAVQQAETLRWHVLQRDHFTCCACGASPAFTPSIELHVDHIVPWSKGGETVLENLQTLCSVCNLGKSNVHTG